MRKTLFVALACVLGLLVAGASSAKPQPKPRLGPLARILVAIEEVGAQVGRGFELLMGEIGDLGSSQAALLDGQEEVLDRQEEVRQELKELADLIGETHFLLAPDLLLVPVEGQMCRDDGETLTFRIANVGTADAGASNLVVRTTAPINPFPDGFFLPTPPIGAGEHYDWVTPLRDIICAFADECIVEVEVDGTGTGLISESNESNNLYLELLCTP
ncbi:MAG: hypothetical protein JRH10_06745 [Deltaproteobacteria bacterium]|nr:hypothetical protein [Deltaproteobacteria bacterium]MBW2447078.1 hypothetical protein [Deltaproteobacteria bacterium]